MFKQYRFSYKVYIGYPVDRCMAISHAARSAVCFSAGLRVVERTTLIDS